MLKCCAISFQSSLTSSPILILLISCLFFPEPVSVLIVFHIPLEFLLFSSKALQKNFLFALLIIIPVLFCFVLDHETLLTIRVLAVSGSITVHKLAIALNVKTSKTWTGHFVFSLRIFVSAHVLIT